MADTRPKVTKAGSKPSITETSTSRVSPTEVLTADRLFKMKDIAATEPVPPFREAVEYKLRVDGGESADVRVVSNGKNGDPACTVLIKTSGSLEETPPYMRGEYLTPQSLSEAAAGAQPFEAHRPAWLDQVYMPKVWPWSVYAACPSNDIGFRPLILELATAEWPWTAIGKLFIQRRGQQIKIGSGVLVGPNLLLTASHAMPWETGDFAVRFVPAYRNGNDVRFGHAYVDQWRGIRHPEGTATGLDYVICKLNWRIGERTGWLGSWWSSDEDFYERRSWFSVGYPRSFLGGERPAVEFNATVEDIDNEGDGLEIETDNFTDGGWSGGPLWGWIEDQPRVIGICSGKDKDGLDPTRSVFAGGEHLVDLVRFGIANWQ
jgi:hypothetical protein